MESQLRNCRTAIPVSQPMDAWQRFRSVFLALATGFVKIRYMNDLRILIVCSGNSCRSPMAENLLKKMIAEGNLPSVEVRSAGTMTGGGSPASENSLLACREVGIDLSRHRSTPMSPRLVAWADIILCMENYHVASVLGLSPSASTKTHLIGEYGHPEDSLEIPDPAGLSLTHYRRCRDRLAGCLEGLIEHLSEIRNRWDTIFIGSDEAGMALKQVLISHLQRSGRKVQNCGVGGSGSQDALGAVLDVGRTVGGHLAEFGILVGISGIEMSIAANKIPGVRAALCADTNYAILSRQLHNANLLCLSAHALSDHEAAQIVEAWLSTDYDDSQENSRVAIFQKLEYQFMG